MEKNIGLTFEKVLRNFLGDALMNVPVTLPEETADTETCMALEELVAKVVSDRDIFQNVISGLQKTGGDVSIDMSIPKRPDETPSTFYPSRIDVFCRHKCGYVSVRMDELSIKKIEGDGQGQINIDIIPINALSPKREVSLDFNSPLLKRDIHMWVKTWLCID